MNEERIDQLIDECGEYFHSLQRGNGKIKHWLAIGYKNNNYIPSSAETAEEALEGLVKKLNG